MGWTEGERLKARQNQTAADKIAGPILDVIVERVAFDLLPRDFFLDASRVGRRFKVGPNILDDGLAPGFEAGELGGARCSSRHYSGALGWAVYSRFLA